MDTMEQVKKAAQDSKGAQVSGVVTLLAELPGDAHIDAGALASVLNRCKKSIQRAVRRGELPAPVKFMGKQVWLVETILAHFRKRQAEALKHAEAIDVRLARHTS